MTNLCHRGGWVCYAPPSTLYMGRICIINSIINHVPYMYCDNISQIQCIINSIKYMYEEYITDSIVGGIGFVFDS